MTENLTVNRQNDLFLTVNCQRDPPPLPLRPSYKYDTRNTEAIFAKGRIIIAHHH